MLLKIYNVLIVKKIIFDSKVETHFKEIKHIISYHYKFEYDMYEPHNCMGNLFGRFILQ